MLERSKVAELQRLLGAELEAIGKRLGWKFTVGRAKYADTVTIQLHAAPLKADGTAESKEAIAFKRDAHYYGFEASDFGRKFTGQRRGVPNRGAEHPRSQDAHSGEASQGWPGIQVLR